MPVAAYGNIFVPSNSSISPQPTPDQTNTLSQQLALKGQAATAGREQQGLDYQQNSNEFGDFFNKYFPQAGSGSSSSTISGNVGGAGGGPITQVPGMGTVGTWTPTPMPAATLPAPQSTSGAAFARAKDQVGGSMQGLMKAMGDQFSARGIGGSSVAANAVGNTLLGGEQQLGEVARDQAMTDTNTANDFAKVGYQGAITQQGQQLGDLANQRSAATTMRGQDITAANAAASLKQTQDQQRMAALTGLWSAFNKGSSGGVLY